MSRLKTFVLVSELGNITKAAEKMYITQSAVSRQLKSLEDDFQIELFIRSKQGVKLTDDGKKCFEIAKNIVKEYDKFMLLIKEIKNTKKSSLKIGYYVLYGRDCIPNAVRSMKLKYPDLSITLELNKLHDLVFALQYKQLDVILTLDISYADTPSIRSETLVPTPLQAIFPNNHPLAKKKRIRFSDLQNEHFIIYNPKNISPAYDFLEDVFKKNSFTPKTIEYIEEFQSIFVLVAAGVGISFSSKIENTNNNYNISYVDVEGMDDMYVQLVWLAENTNPMIPKFIKEVKKFWMVK